MDRDLEYRLQQLHGSNGPPQYQPHYQPQYQPMAPAARPPPPLRAAHYHQQPQQQEMASYAYALPPQGAYAPPPQGAYALPPTQPMAAAAAQQPARAAQARDQRSKKRRTNLKSHLMTWSMMIVSTAIYLVVGAAVFTQYEGWTVTDSVYFCVVTMSTVGYGDLSPTTDGTKLATVFFILVGIIGVFSQIANAFQSISTPVTSAGRDILERCCPRRKVDIDGDGTADFSYPLPAPLYYAKNLLPSVLLNATLQGLSALAYSHLEGWTYLEALYHCVVTATTVGYGSPLILTQEGRVWSCVHILISVILLGELISTFGTLSAERAAIVKRLQQLERKLDPDLLTGLLSHAADLRPRVAQTGSLSELEFAIAMMLELQMVSIDQVRPFILQFRELDADHSGEINAVDLDAAIKAKTAENAPSKSPNRHRQVSPTALVAQYTSSLSR